MPKLYDQLHLTFHVSLLKKFRQWPGKELEAPPPIEVDGDDEWEVETILDTRKRYGKQEFLVKWKGYPPYENSWEPEENLTNAPEVV